MLLCRICDATNDLDLVSQEAARANIAIASLVINTVLIAVRLVFSGLLLIAQIGKDL